MNASYFLFYLMIKKREKKKNHSTSKPVFFDMSNHHVSHTFLEVCSESVFPDRQSWPVVLAAQGILAVNTLHLMF